MRRLLFSFSALVLLAAVTPAMAIQCPTCTVPPTSDTAIFKVGTPVYANGKYTVPLIADTGDPVTFSQMAIRYDSNCLTYVANSAGVGNDVSNVPVNSLFVDDKLITGTTRQILLSVNGTYTGCDKEVFTLEFQYTGPPTQCDLEWFSTDTGPNSENHLNWDNTAGGDGKITPNDITFCDGVICDFQTEITGDVLYYSNLAPIIALVPDNPGSAPVTVEDITQNPTTSATSPNGDYTLDYGQGPVPADVTASRPGGLTICGTNEDGVISGDDLILLQDEVALTVPNKTFSVKQNLAGDVNGDGMALPDNSDVLAVKRWIGRKVCDLSDACMPQGTQIKNCAGTWKFLFFADPNKTNPDVFAEDHLDLGEVCEDQTVPIEGILIGDVDGSWPAFFNKSGVPVNLALEEKAWQGDQVTIALSVNLEDGESLRHIIYSLEYDPNAFEYTGMSAGSAAPAWGAFDNPDQRGMAHGIAHRPPMANALTQSGDVLEFHFRALRSDASSEISFSRLKANDIDVSVPVLEIAADNVEVTDNTKLPTKYAISSHPNPFNPRTQIEYTIPAGAVGVPVQLRVYDITGRLVRTLENTQRGAGRYLVNWNGTGDDGQSVGTGIYLLRIEAGEWSATEKLTLVK